MTMAGASVEGSVPWHALSPEDALERQGVDAAAGLSASEAAARLAKHGPNRFAEAAREPRWQAFLRQYRDPMQIVLLAAGVISQFIPNQFWTGVVLIGLTLNAGAQLFILGPEASHNRLQGPLCDRAVSWRSDRRGPAAASSRAGKAMPV